MSKCCFITKKGTQCSRNAVVGESTCKQHIYLAHVQKQAAERKAYLDAQNQQLTQKLQEQSRIKQQKRGTEEQRSKFRSDVLEAWYAARQPQPILVSDSSHLGYDSELEVFEDGIGICSDCGKTSYCVKVSHGQVYCVESRSCGADYCWYYDSPLNYPLEIPEEFRK